MDCPTREEIRVALDRGRRTAGAALVVRHLLECPHCRRSALNILPADESAARALGVVLRHPRAACEPPDDAYAAAFERCRSRLRPVLRDVAQAGDLAAELLSQPRERWRLLAQQGRFSNPGVVQRLLDESRETKFTEPDRAIDLAEVGLAIAERIPPDRFSRSFLRDLRGRAWTAVGAAYRWSADPRGAEKAFAEAGRLLEDCADPIAVGVYLHFLAGLRIDQRRFADGRALLRHAIAHYQEAGDDGRVARALTTLGGSYTDEGDPAEALPLLSEALERVDEAEDPRTAFYARHSLAVSLVELGETEQARPLAAASRRWAAAHGDRYLGVRGVWLEGLLEAAAGQEERAESLLRQARAALDGEGQAYWAALVTLDLAVLLAGQGRADEVRSLSLEAAASLLAFEVHREAAAALALLCRAAVEGRANAAMVAAVGRFVRRVRFDPGARFEREA